MNQDDRSHRRRLGALAGLSAAAGAALAAAMIPAAPAFADSTDDAVAAAAVTGGGGGTTETPEQTIDGIATTAAGGNSAEANFDVDAINTALSHSPGGATGESTEETFLVAHPSDVTDVAKVDDLIYNDPFHFGGEGAIGSAAAAGDSSQLFQAVAVDQLLFDFVFNAGGAGVTAFDPATLLP
jgi:hypothetical protein